MHRQSAQSWGGLAILLSFVLLVAAVLVGAHPAASCAGTGAGQYCTDTYPYANDAVNVAIVAVMTFLIGIVILAMSRDLPLAPVRSAKTGTAPEGTRTDLPEDDGPWETPEVSH